MRPKLKGIIMYKLIPLFLVLVVSESSYVRKSNSQGNAWFRQGQKTLDEKLEENVNTNVAKNIIMMVGDGMGVSTVTAARIFKGQQEGKTGEETEFFIDKFPYTGLAKTYCVDYQVPDSAPTAAAIVSGIKTNYETLGLDDKVVFGECGTGRKVSSLLDWSLQKGKSVGIVTNTRVTHATPAATFAHTPNRNWEGDTLVDPSQRECKDIAFQLVMENPNIQVIFGGGRRYILSENETDPELNSKHPDQRKDMSLLQEWIKDKENRMASYKYVWNKQQFDAINPDSTDFVLGLFESSHMQFEAERDKSASGEPSLQEMTEKAIEILRKNPNGFFLFVESGRLDEAHHLTRARLAFEEAVMFDDTISSASKMTSEEDTLMVVTADHSHTMTIGGFITRGNNILGIVDTENDSNGLPFTTLSYANGPIGRRDLNGIDTTTFEFQQGSFARRDRETHSGEDVAVYAKGPMSHLLTGTYEQNFIAHAAAYAACIGDNEGHCRDRTTK